MFNLSDESCSSNPAMIRRKKIAISIIISLPEREEENHNFQEFFFSHFPLFESHMNKLKTAIERVSVESTGDLLLNCGWVTIVFK